MLRGIKKVMDPTGFWVRHTEDQESKVDVLKVFKSCVENSNVKGFGAMSFSWL